MFRPVAGHLILMPFLVGFVPMMTTAVFGSFWVGLGLIGVPYIFGPIARWRREFLLNPNFKLRDHLWFLALMFISIFTGSAVGTFMFRTAEGTVL